MSIHIRVARSHEVLTEGIISKGGREGDRVVKKERVFSKKKKNKNHLKQPEVTGNDRKSPEMTGSSCEHLEGGWTANQVAFK